MLPISVTMLILARIVRACLRTRSRGQVQPELEGAYVAYGSFVSLWGSPVLGAKGRSGICIVGVLSGGFTESELHCY
jgi:hypothetical protein